jgi:hypothetical protein
MGRDLFVADTPVDFLVKIIDAPFLVVVPQNLIRAYGNAGDSPRQAAAMDFGSGKRRLDGYTALFLSRPTQRQRDV